MHHEYDDTFVRGLEWMWGEGFLSPGGAAEVAAILAATPVAGAHVLDVGCGIGGVDVVLVADHGAGHVTGIDIEPALVERARERVGALELSGRIDCRVVEPGPLPFGDESFDGVFSKDSLIHVPDKEMVYAEMYRVLRPGGWLAVGDWLGGAAPRSDAMKRWLDAVGLSFSLDTLDRTVSIAANAGFVAIESTDRNAWYMEEMRRELATLEGASFDRLVAAIGEDSARCRLASSTLKYEVVRGGELRPAHIRARKPG